MDQPDKARQLMHDARNYLNVVVTANRCLARYEELPPTYQRFVDSISVSSERLREVLDSILEEMLRPPNDRNGTPEA